MEDPDQVLADRRRSAQQRIEACDRLTTSAGHKAVWDVLADETDDIDVRIAAIRVIGRSPGAVNQLTRRFHPPAVRGAAVAELERLAQLPAEPKLERMMPMFMQMLQADPGGPALGNLGKTYGRDRRVLEAARRAAGDPRPEVRSRAFGALAEVGEIDDVLTGASDPNAEVRAWVAYLIGFLSLRREADVAALERLAQDSDADVRSKAITGLRRLEVQPLPGVEPPAARSGDPEWVALLQALAAKVRADREIAVELSDEALSTGWLGGEGATADELRATEARLGLTLPRSYRAFLETSNGWGPTSFFLERLLRAEEIVRFADSEPEWIEAWKDNDEAPDLRSALQVSSVTDNGVCLLIPSPAEDWETWFFANWIPGAHRHKSFLDFMRTELERP